MSQGGSYGGGQSSLGYLFGSEKPPIAQPPRPPIEPPYGIDTVASEKPPVQSKNSIKSDPDLDKEKVVSNNNYHRAQGPNLGNFVSDRPSTRVKSVPGGDSSLGYLFGDK